MQTQLLSRWMFRGLALAATAVSSAAGLADERGDFFESRVRPLLVRHCIGCHGPDEQSGGLRLDSANALAQGGESGPAVLAGQPNASRLIQAVRREGDLQMPPDQPLSNEEQNVLTAWVRDGGHWPRDVVIGPPTAEAARAHWAFQPLAAVAPPQAAGEDDPWLTNPIDAFLWKAQRDRDLPHSPPADRRTYLRRVAFALTGLPPAPDAAEEFLEDPDPRAAERLVDRMLSSPAYGEHWARRWLDVARYSDTKGYVYAREERFWVHAWPYRDWVVRALNEDLPYDRFLLLQLAADQVPDRRPHDLAAMGFLTLGRRFLGVQRDIIDDRIDVVTRGLMSLTVGCARCHDHKYDPIPTADYYALYGVFASCRERLTPLGEPQGADQASLDAFQTELDARLTKLNDTLQQRRREVADRVRQRVGDYLAAQFELEKYPEEGFDQVISSDDLLPSFVRRWSRRLREAELQQDRIFPVWRSFLAGRIDGGGGGVAGGSPPDTNRLVAEAFPSPPSTREELVAGYANLFGEIISQWGETLAAAEQAGDPAPASLPDPDAEEIRRLLFGERSPCVAPDEPIVHTEYDFDSGVCNELWKLQGEVDRWIIQSAVEAPFAVVLEDRPHPVTARVFLRGDPRRLGPEAPRQFLQLLSGPDREPFQVGSGRLEMARAIIDPGNPLTARVIVNRVWAHHFGQGLVATPGDFGARAAPPSHPELLDWLAGRFMESGWSLKSLHRWILTSHAFSQSSFGPPDPEARRRAEAADPANQYLWRMNNRRLTFEELRDSMLSAAGVLRRDLGGKPRGLFDPPFPMRRTLYTLVDRQFLPSVLRVFDFANPDLHTPERSDTTAPQQALFLMNHPWALSCAKQLAERVQGRAAPAMVDALHRHAVQRPPSPSERRDAIAFLRQAAPAAEAPSPTVADWSYGYGALDESAGRVASFTPLPHFTGDAWQGSDAYPDAQLGWAKLDAAGGHPGNDRSRACIRRWTAPRDMTLQLRSRIVHEAEPGDGVRAFLVSSRQGVLQEAKAHRQTVDWEIPSLVVEQGETLDFLCDIGDVLNSDQHLWRITLEAAEANGESPSWDSQADFTPRVARFLTPLEQLAQVLLSSNEFFFVD